MIETPVAHKRLPVMSVLGFLLPFPVRFWKGPIFEAFFDGLNMDILRCFSENAAKKARTVYKNYTAEKNKNQGFHRRSASFYILQTFVFLA